MIGIFLVSDNSDTLRVFKNTLDGHPDLVLPGELLLQSQTLDQLTETQPDLVILLAEPSDSIFTFADALKSVRPALPLFWVASEINLVNERHALTHSIEAVFSQAEDATALMENIRAICGDGNGGG